MSARDDLLALAMWGDDRTAPALLDAYRAEVLAEGGPRVWHVFEEDTPVTVPPLFASEEAARDETIARYQEMEGSCPDYSWRPGEDGSWELLAGGEPVGIYLTQVPVNGAPEDQQKLIDQLRADRNAYADRVDTLTAVAKGNKRHVQALTGELETAQARVTAAVESPLAWADQLDAKSLDNFLISLGQAVEYEPIDGAIAYIHELLNSFRVAVAAWGGESR